MIDNYDSFTYNIVQYLGELGADVVVKRNDAIDVAGIRALHPAAIVISPGPCTPTEAGISLTLLREMAGEVPMLGVCLGLQCIGEAFGGKVVRADRLMHGKTSPIIHDGKTIFAGIASPFDAMRYHSLLVDAGRFRRRWKSAPVLRKTKSWDFATNSMQSKAYSFIPNRF